MNRFDKFYNRHLLISCIQLKFLCILIPFDRFHQVNLNKWDNHHHFLTCSLFRMTQSLSVKFTRHTSRVYRTSYQLSGMTFCAWLLVTRLVCLCWAKDEPGVLCKRDAKRRRHWRLSLIWTCEICLSAKKRVLNEWLKGPFQKILSHFSTKAFNVKWDLKIEIYYLKKVGKMLV